MTGATSRTRSSSSHSTVTLWPATQRPPPAVRGTHNALARTDVGLANQRRVISELAGPEVAYHPPEPRDAWLERRGWGVCLRLRAAGDGRVQVRRRGSAYRRPVAGACSKNLFLPLAFFGLEADCAALCGKGQRAGGQLPRLVRCHHPCTCEHSDRPLTHGDGCAQEDRRVRCIPDRFARLV